jgi:4-amino-4-deoxychorismate lyase
MAEEMIYEQLLNGVPVTLADLPKLAGLNSGHFTAMQVRDGKVKGGPLHLARLKAASIFLFGSSLPDETIRSFIRISSEGRSCSLRVHIFPAAANIGAIGPEDLQVLIIRSAPLEMNTTPITAGTAIYERFLPQIKHAGIAIGLIHHKRDALLNGYDDVLYTSAAGEISEGSIWNIGFFDGKGFVFPAAPALPGIMLQLIMTGLKQLKIPVTVAPVYEHQLTGFSTAFLMNSITAAQPIRQINETVFPVEVPVFNMLQHAYEQTPWEWI